MAEWAVYWQAIGIVAAIIFGGFGLWKIFHELRRLNEQRQNEQKTAATAEKLKRTEFFLTLHRRLFDDDDLYEILCLIDGDTLQLVDKKMWDKKRKFLTFIEEIALLIRAGQIDKNVAYYMFGYYAKCAKEGKHFGVGIIPTRVNWGLFCEFVECSNEFLNNNSDGPPADMTF